jgi:hypothetical protein
VRAVCQSLQTLLDLVSPETKSGRAPPRDIRWNVSLLKRFRREVMPNPMSSVVQPSELAHASRGTAHLALQHAHSLRRMFRYSNALSAALSESHSIDGPAHVYFYAGAGRARVDVSSNASDVEQVAHRNVMMRRQRSTM